jgi:hypothetical protein
MCKNQPFGNVQTLMQGPSINLIGGRIVPLLRKGIAIKTITLLQSIYFSPLVANYPSFFLHDDQMGVIKASDHLVSGVLCGSGVAICNNGIGFRVSLVLA